MCEHRGANVEAILRFVQLVQLSASLLIVTHPSFAGNLNKQHKKDVLQVLQDDTIPHFDALITGIDAIVGETVLLPCTVRNMGDKVASWMRCKDLSILTSGEITFSADNRFESVHNLEADFWGLRIRGVRLNDAGQYECQVNTDPKINLAVNLRIKDRSSQVAQSSPSPYWINRAQIKSSKEISARQGSTLSLTCEITPNESYVDDPVMKKARVRWVHDETEITSKFDEGGISIETEYRQEEISSRLIINVLQQKHAGRYTCMQNELKADSVQLRVFDDLEQNYVEAMQGDSAYSSGGPSRTISKMIIILLYLVFLRN